mmetsp:Transcript_64064/g.179240  ORF Transcript_64064/g.179240 Transcript_64064/m.179240 type:complete len:536 (-) Transcript_64064:409-2016(-)
MREEVSDPLRGQHREHERHDQLQGARQLVHDHDEGDRDAAHAAQDGGGPDHRIDARMDGRAAEAVEEDAEASAEARAGVQRGHEEAAWDARAERHRHLQEPHERREGEGRDEVGADVRLVAVAEAHHVRAHGEVVDAMVEERPDRLRRQPLRVPRRIARDGRDDGDAQDLGHDGHALPEGAPVAARGADGDVPVHEEGAEDAAHGAEEDEPRVFSDRRHLGRVRLEHREPAGSCRVVPQQSQRRDDGGKERPDHGPLREHRAHLLVGEEHAAERRPKGHGHACRRRRADELPPLGLVLHIALGQLRAPICPTTRHVHKRTFLAQAHAGRHRQDQAEDLHHQGLEVQHLAHHESSQDGLDLGDAAAARHRGEGPDQGGGDRGEHHADGGVARVVQGRLRRGRDSARPAGPSTAARLLADEPVAGAPAEAQGVDMVRGDLHEAARGRGQDAHERRDQPRDAREAKLLKGRALLQDGARMLLVVLHVVRPPGDRGEAHPLAQRLLGAPVELARFLAGELDGRRVRERLDESVPHPLQR